MTIWFSASVAPTLATVALADSDGWGHMGGWGWGMAIFGWLFMAALIGLVAWLIVSAVRRPESSDRGGQRALELLDERYARGEIDRDEYLERRDDLSRR